MDLWGWAACLSLSVFEELKSSSLGKGINRSMIFRLRLVRAQGLAVNKET